MPSRARLKISRPDRIRKKLRAIGNYSLMTMKKNPHPTTVKDMLYELFFLCLVGCLGAEIILFVKFLSES